MTHEKLRNGSTHESAHALADHLHGYDVESVTLSVDADGVLNGNVHVSASNKSHKVLDFVACKLVGIAAEEILCGVPRQAALEAAQDDIAAVEKMLDKFNDDDRQYFCLQGMEKATEFVKQNTTAIELLAAELELHGCVPGSRVREIATAWRHRIIRH